MRRISAGSAYYFQGMARVQGFEPRQPESESGVLPLDDTRSLIPLEQHL